MTEKSTKPLKAALYARVSTGSQSTENQLRELREAAERLGWVVVAEYVDHGISGAKGRKDRPPAGRNAQGRVPQGVRRGGVLVSGQAGKITA